MSILPQRLQPCRESRAGLDVLDIADVVGPAELQIFELTDRHTGQNSPVVRRTLPRYEFFSQRPERPHEMGQRGIALRARNSVEIEKQHGMSGPICSSGRAPRRQFLRMDDAMRLCRACCAAEPMLFRMFRAMRPVHG